MSMILFIAAVASSSGSQMVCTEASSSEETPKSFTISFIEKKGKLSKIAVQDPGDVLDPLGKLPVYSGSGGSGPLVITKSEPPSRPPMKLNGSASASGDYRFNAKAPMLDLQVKSSTGDGSYTYSFQGSRLLSGIMRMGYEGNGSCILARAESDGTKK